MSLVGKNVDLYIFDSSVWKLVACARSVSLNIQTEFIETTVAGSGRFATFLPTKNSFTGTIDGVVSLNEPGMLGLPDLRQKQINGSSMLIRFERTDADGDVYTDEATFFISNSSDVASFDNINTFNLTIQGSGLINLIFTPILPVPVTGVLVKRFEYTATGGETGFTDASLINKYILEVNVDGISAGKILSTGTPIGDDVKYIPSTGQFIFGVVFEAGEEIYVLYQDQ